MKNIISIVTKKPLTDKEIANRVKLVHVHEKLNIEQWSKMHGMRSFKDSLKNEFEQLIREDQTPKKGA